MSSLRSALDELRGDDLLDTPPEQPAEELVELREAAEALEAEWIRRLNAFNARLGWAADASLSLSAWLRARCRMSGAAAADRSRLARALRKMPLTQRAYSDGDLTTAHVRALSAGAEAHPETFARDEEVLASGASTVSAGDTRKLVDYWRQNLDHAEALDHADQIHQRRRLSISRTWQGMVRIDGDLDPEAGEVVFTAIGSLVDESVKSGSPDDNRTPTQRRAVSGPTRRALVIRDKECRFDGCRRPAPWCDAHHIIHWADGGETTLDNLVLLCRSHHRMVHEGRFPSPKP